MAFYFMTSPITFVTQAYDELKKVVWPTREELTKLTIIVLFISLIVGVYIGGIDLILTKITETLIK
jgi:preprotein translocase subunit SecE